MEVETQQSGSAESVDMIAGPSRITLDRLARAESQWEASLSQQGSSRAEAPPAYMRQADAPLSRTMRTLRQIELVVYLRQQAEAEARRRQYRREAEAYQARLAAKARQAAKQGTMLSEWQQIDVDALSDWSRDDDESADEEQAESVAPANVSADMPPLESPPTVVPSSERTVSRPSGPTQAVAATRAHSAALETPKKSRERRALETGSLSDRVSSHKRRSIFSITLPERVTSPTSERRTLPSVSVSSPSGGGGGAVRRRVDLTMSIPETSSRAALLSNGSHLRRAERVALTKSVPTSLLEKQISPGEQPGAELMFPLPTGTAAEGGLSAPAQLDRSFESVTTEVDESQAHDPQAELAPADEEAPAPAVRADKAFGPMRPEDLAEMRQALLQRRAAERAARAGGRAGQSAAAMHPACDHATKAASPRRTKEANGPAGSHWRFSQVPDVTDPSVAATKSSSLTAPPAPSTSREPDGRSALSSKEAPAQSAAVPQKRPAEPSRTLLLGEQAKPPPRSTSNKRVKFTSPLKANAQTTAQARPLLALREDPGRKQKEAEDAAAPGASKPQLGKAVAAEPKSSKEEPAASPLPTIWSPPKVPKYSSAFKTIDHVVKWVEARRFSGGKSGRPNAAHTLSTEELAKLIKGMENAPLFAGYRFYLLGPFDRSCFQAVGRILQHGGVFITSYEEILSATDNFTFILANDPKEDCLQQLNLAAERALPCPLIRNSWISTCLQSQRLVWDPEVIGRPPKDTVIAHPGH